MKFVYNKIKASFMSRDGFSLVELLIATALLAVVAAGFMMAVQGTTASSNRLMNIQKERERVAGTRDAYLAKTDESIKNDIAARLVDPDKPNYELITVSVAGKSFTCYKVAEEGSNLQAFVKKPEDDTP